MVKGGQKSCRCSLLPRSHTAFNVARIFSYKSIAKLGLHVIPKGMEKPSVEGLETEQGLLVRCSIYFDMVLLTGL